MNYQTHPRWKTTKLPPRGELRLLLLCLLLLRLLLLCLLLLCLLLLLRLLLLLLLLRLLLLLLLPRIVSKCDCAVPPLSGEE